MSEILIRPMKLCRFTRQKSELGIRFEQSETCRCLNIQSDVCFTSELNVSVTLCLC